MISEWIAQNDSNYSKDNQLIHLHYKMRCDETADLFKETNGGNSSSECNIIVSISFFSLNQIQQVSQHQHCDCRSWVSSILIPHPIHAATKPTEPTVIARHRLSTLTLSALTIISTFSSSIGSSSSQPVVILNSSEMSKGALFVSFLYFTSPLFAIFIYVCFWYITRTPADSCRSPSSFHISHHVIISIWTKWVETKVFAVLCKRT